MNHLFKLILSLVALTACFSCTYSGAIRTDIAPTAMVAQKQPLNVGVYFTPRLVQYEEVAQPSSHLGSAHTFKFSMGPAIKESLTKSVETAYARVTVVSSPPALGEFDRVITFDLQSSNVRIEFVPGFWTNTAKADAIIHVTMNVMDHDQPVQRLTVSGTGFSAKTFKGGSGAQKQFSKAIEDAIRQLANNTANLLISTPIYQKPNKI